VTFDSYPKPGSYSPEVFVSQDSFTWLKVKVITQNINVPFTATISSSVTTSYAGNSKLLISGSGLRELSRDKMLKVLVCDHFACV
jgi:hypothetical protein